MVEVGNLVLNLALRLWVEPLCWLSGGGLCVFFPSVCVCMCVRFTLGQEVGGGVVVDYAVGARRAFFFD